MTRFFNRPVIILLILLVVLNILEGDFSDPLQWLISKLVMLPGIIIGLSFHEFAHGAVSTMLGDPTPRAQGRLTLNPLAHFEPVGFISLLIAGFGWGIPVQIDPSYYKHPRLGEFLVAIAGVTMNFIIAVVFSFVLKICVDANMDVSDGSIGLYIMLIIQQIILINIVLMVFNLLPIPPLDGFGIITEIFNLKKYSWYPTLYSYGLPILMICILFGVTRTILNPATSAVYSFLMKMVGLA